MSEGGLTWHTVLCILKEREGKEEEKVEQEQVLRSRREEETDAWMDLDWLTLSFVAIVKREESSKAEWIHSLEWRNVQRC